MITPKFLKKLAPELSLVQYNDLTVLVLEHAKGTAKIALQGAQLLNWKPTHTSQDVLWLSDIEPFTAGNAIRGGIPICFPWFGGTGSPSHGYARISLWELSNMEITPEKARLEFSLYLNQQVEAKITMLFSEECELQFSHLEQKSAQLALHSYFNIGDINQLKVQNLPTSTFNSLTQQVEDVPSPRTINQLIDCIYSAEQGTTVIQDNAFQREIEIEHINASDIVLWNPWHKSTSSMSVDAYKNMICIETGRIRNELNHEPVCVKIRVKPH